MTFKDLFLSPDAKAKKIRQAAILPVSLLLFLLTGLLIHGLSTGDFLLWEMPEPEAAPVISDASFDISSTPRPRMEQGEEIMELRLRFGQSAAPLDAVGKEVSEGVELRPEVPGTWQWIDDRSLVFTPEQEWTPGQEFKVKVDKSILAEHMSGRSPERSFRVAPFEVSFSGGEFYIDPRDPNIKRVTTELRFNYPVNEQSLRSLVSLVPRIPRGEEEPAFDNLNLQVDVTLRDDGLGAYLVSQPLPMPQEDVSLEFRLLEGLQSSFGGNAILRDKTKSVTMPGLNNFIKVLDLEMTLLRREDYTMEQLIVLSTKGESRSVDVEDYLDIRVLPVHRPAQEGVEARQNYRWSNPAEINDFILDRSDVLDYSIKETQREYSSLQSMAVDIIPGRYLYVRLRRGAPFYGGYNLARDYETILQVPQFPRSLEIMGDGAVLSMGGAQQVTLIAQGVDRAQATLYRVLPGQLNHLVTQTRGDLSNLRFSNNNFNENNISEVFSEYIDFPGGNPREVEFSSIDLGDYLHRAEAQRNGFFFLKVRDVQGRASVNRFVMVTDLGLLCKRNNDNSSDLFVQSISSGLPVGGAAVEVLGRNGLAVFTGTTNAQGRVSIPVLSTSRSERAPVAITVRRNGDLSFLPYNNSDRRMNFSNFDTGGVHDAGDDDTLKAYLFSDRGMYRPGESFHIGMILKAGNWRRSLEGTPLRVMITNPRGVQIYQRDFNLGAMAFEELEYQTEAHFPTGNYQISLYLIERNNHLTSLGSTHIELKEFLPDRLTIDSTIQAQPARGWVSMEDLNLLVSLKNLFGTAAVGNEVEATMELQPAWFYFNEFRDYNFRDPYRNNESYQRSLPMEVTDEGGQVRFPLDLSQFDLGSYRLTTQAYGFEKDSGRNVTTVSSILVSPNEYLVGWKAEGDFGYIHRDADRKVEFIAVNPNLERLNLDSLELVISETQYVSVLTRQPNGTYAYESVEKTEELQRRSLAISAQGTQLDIDSSNPGSFTMELINSQGQVLATVPYTVVGQGNLSRSLDSNTELQIRLDKESYVPGETIEVFIKAPFSGSGLITIEQDRVYAHQWFRATGNTTVQRITLPEGLEGNGYINVSFIRAANSDRIYVNPLSYGAVPFSVDREGRINQIDLQVPQVVKPGDILEIDYSTESAGQILLFGVDKGILQVANYQTPDPLAEFLKKRALEVQSYQILDLILPEFEMAGNQSPYGGGGGYDRLLEANLNPFARKRDDPVVFWSGILENPQRSGTYEYEVPDYFNGEIQIFAVAVGAADIGVITQSSTVRDDLIIQPTLPLFAAPGDEFVLSVNVANNILVNEEERPVLVELECSEHLELLEEDRQIQDITAGREGIYRFRIKVSDELGSGDITIRASTGHYESQRMVSLSIRPAMAYQVRLQTGTVNARRTEEMELFIDQYAQFQEKEVHMSYMPLAVTGGLADYLDHYPYSCTEQITSKTFPYVSFFQVPDVDMDKAEARRRVTRTMDTLMSRLQTQGGFGYWHSQSYVDVSFSLYAYHFILEAIEEGFAVPTVLMQRGESFLWEVARGDYRQSVTLFDRSYAIYLLTRMGERTTNELTELKALVQDQDHWRRSRTLPFMAASFDMLQMDEEAQETLNQIEWGALATALGVYNYYQYNTQYLYLVARHFPGEIRRLNELMPTIMETLENQQYNTINAAWTIMALTELAKNQPSVRDQDFVMHLLNQAGEALAVNPQGTLLWSASMPMNHPTLRLENNNSLDLYYQISESGFDLSIPEEGISQGIEVFSEVQVNNRAVTSLNMGDQADWVLSVRTNEKDSFVSRVAVVALLPGGLEILPGYNPSYDRNLEYMDVREDRVVLYMNISDDLQTISVPVQAVSRGDFVYPPLFAQAMYDPTLKAYSEGGRFQIEGP